MARIPVYQQGNIPSAAVGIPQEDTSKQIIANSISDAANVGVNILKERREKADTLAAMAKFGEYELDYETKKAEKKKEFFQDPTRFPEAARDEGYRLLEQHSKDLSPKQREKFRGYVENKLMQDASNLVSWVNTRDQQQILGNVQKTHTDLALLAEAVQDPGGLKELLGRLDVVSQESSSMVDEPYNQALKEQTRKDIVRGSLTGAILADAQKAYAELVKRKYEGVMTPEEEKQYTLMAKEVMVNQAILSQYQSLTSSIVEASELTDSVLSGDTPPADIARRRDWALLNKDRKDVNGQPVVSEELIRTYDGAFKMAMGARPLPATALTDAERAFATGFQGKWANLWAGKKRQYEVKDFDEIIGMYADLVEARNTGVVDEARFNDLKYLMDAKVSTMISRKKVSSALTTALEKAGKYNFFNNPNDVYSAGYKIIDRHINERKDLSAEEKIRFKEAYLLQFTKEVNAIPEEQRNKIENVNRYALDKLMGTDKNPGLFSRLDVYQHPETGAPIRVGDKISYGGADVIFLGNDPETGELILDVGEDTIKGFDRK